MISKKAVIVALVITALATMSIFGAGLVIAETKDAVEILTGDHEAEHEEMHAQCENGLDEAVEEGKITETQKQELQAIMDKKKAGHEDMKDLTPEERREAMETHHDELNKWAEDNDVDLKDVLGHTPGEGGGHGPGHKMGSGHMGSGRMGSGQGPGTGTEI